MLCIQTYSRYKYSAKFEPGDIVAPFENEEAAHIWLDQQKALGLNENWFERDNPDSDTVVRYKIVTAVNPSA